MGNLYRCLSTPPRGVLAVLLLLAAARVVASEEPPPSSLQPSPQPTAIAAAQPSAAESPPPAPPADEAKGGDDLDPTKLVFFNVRLQHAELGDGNALDVLLLRRDVALRRPKSWRPGPRLALLRADLPVGHARLGGKTFDGIGDLYAQALNTRSFSPRFSLLSGFAFQFPTASEDVLGTGKWLVVPTVIPLWRVPGRGMVFTRFQDFVSVAGDEERRDVHYLSVNPNYLKILGRRFVLVDTEMFADWERGGEMSWKSGLLVGTALAHQRAVWLKLEVPWGEHRNADWLLKASLALRGRH